MLLSRFRSRAAMAITLLRARITPLRSTHEPSSPEDSAPKLGGPTEGHDFGMKLIMTAT